MSVYIKIPQLTVKEGSAFTATSYFRSGEAASAPTTASYRVDCLTTGKVLTDWASLTPAASIAISISPTENAIQNVANRDEIKQLTVARDPDTATQERESVTWKVENIRGF